MDQSQYEAVKDAALGYYEGSLTVAQAVAQAGG